LSTGTGFDKLSPHTNHSGEEESVIVDALSEVGPPRLAYAATSGDYDDSIRGPRSA
jgi:hypothetical protein